jgi:prevent-host-death family protein
MPIHCMRRNGWRDIPVGGPAWSGGDLVLVDEAAEDVASPEDPGAVGSRNGLRRVKVEAAMGASPGVVIDVLGADRLQVASAEDQEVVEAPTPRWRALSHVCYIRGMTEVASRELRNDTRGLLRRVAAGEDIVITVDGEPVAALRPLRRRPRWMQRTEFVRRLSGRQADPGLDEELRALAPDMTDELER